MKDDIKLTDDGIQYKVYDINGKMIRLFNSPVNKRLKYETREEYVVRRKILKDNLKRIRKGYITWESLKDGTFINNNKTNLK